MPERARRIASRLRHFFGDRRHARRVNAGLPITVGPSGLRAGNGFRRQVSLEGHTLDISTSGLALIVPAIRIGEHYLTGEDKQLWLKLEFPEQTIDMQVAPVRYECLDTHETERGYLIGVRITEMTEEHRAIYQQYVQRLFKRPFNH